jgi:glycerate dehydrogenase
MDIYINFPSDDNIKSIANSILSNYNIHWFPDYYDAEIQVIKNQYIIGKNTKMIQTISAGVDSIDIKNIPQNVVVCSNAGAYSISVGEHVYALLLSCTKNIIKNNEKMHDQIFEQNPSMLLYDKTMGILGYGGIGKRVAKLATCFGMNPIAYSRSSSDENISMLYSEVEPVITKSDVLVIALPLTDKTRGLINKTILSLLKKDVIIINVARADIVVKNDILNYLKNHKNSYYLSDVWWEEPNITDTNLDNIILTPHIAGGMSGEIMDIAYKLAFTNVREYIAGNEKNIVRRDDYKT